MDSERLLRFIGYFPDYLSALSFTLLGLFLDNLCQPLSVKRNSLCYASMRCLFVSEKRFATLKRFRLARLVKKLTGECMFSQNFAEVYPVFQCKMPESLARRKCFLEAFADVNSVYNGNMKHARAIEFDQKGSFCVENGSFKYVDICQSEY